MKLTFRNKNLFPPLILTEQDIEPTQDDEKQWTVATLSHFRVTDQKLLFVHTVQYEHQSTKKR